MQKKIIALAIAGLASTAAFAQTNVQIYGVADAAYIYTNVSGGNTLNTVNGNERHAQSTSSIQSGQLAGSRLGFKGTEDLGNGLKALFTLEYSLDLDTNTTIGAGATGVRQSFVGLESKAGTVALGRQYAPGYFTLAMDPTVASPALSSVDASQAFIGATIRATGAARWNNAVTYKSPNFGGVSVQMIRSMGEQPNNLEAGAGTGVGVDYAGGPVAVKYVYHRAAIGAVGAANNGMSDEHYLGASVDLKVLKLMGSVQMVDFGGKGLAGANPGGRASQGMAAQFGAIVPVGKGNLHLSYAYGDNNGSTRAGSTNRGELNSVNVAYTHPLSKRTTLYTGYRYTDNDQSNAGAIINAFGAGINHQF